MKVEWIEGPEMYDSTRPLEGLVSRFHSDVLDLIDSGEMTAEQSEAIREWCDVHRCPECGQ
jgi:hypothetical protein